MLIILRRHFWLLGVTVALVCGLLAMNGANQLVEARDIRAPELPVIEERARAPAPGQVIDKTGDGLVTRNMFCSTCAPPEPGAIEESVEGDAIPLTSLPIDLLATSIATRDDDNTATLRHRDSGQQGAYGLGDRVPGGGPIERIGGTNVIFRSSASGRLERLVLGSAARQEPVAAAPAPVRRSASRGRTDPYADRIHDNGNGSYQIDAELMKQLTENPMSIKGVRFMPHMDNGAIVGMKLAYARPGSLAGALGMRRGDIVQSINGLELTNPDNLLDIYTRLRGQSRFEATVLRGDKPVTLRYSVQ